MVREYRAAEKGRHDRRGGHQEAGARGQLGDRALLLVERAAGLFEGEGVAVGGGRGGGHRASVRTLL